MRQQHLQQHGELVVSVRHELLPAAQAADDVAQGAETHVDALGFLQPVTSSAGFPSSLASRQIDQGQLADTGNARCRVLCLN